MIAEDEIPQSAELFTANLGSWRDKNDPDKGESFYTFGYIDQDVVKGQEIYYAPVDNSQGFWQFDSTSATVNGKTITRSGNKAIADTGTTLALVDDETVKAIYDAIPGASYDSDSQGYIYPSDTPADKLPTVTFAVGDKQFTVQKEDLGFAEAKSGYVYGGIQSRGENPFDILGDTFLKSVYAVSSSPIIYYFTMGTVADNNLFGTPDLRCWQQALRSRAEDGTNPEHICAPVPGVSWLAVAGHLFLNDARLCGVPRNLT